MRPFSHSEAGLRRGASATQISWWMRNLSRACDKVEAARRPFRLTLCSQYAVIATGLTQVEVTPVLVVKALTEYSND